MELEITQTLLIGLAALIVGFTKTSVGGVGILAVLIMAIAIPGKGSPGILLPMLLLGDIFAVIYYHRECQWKILFKIFPLTAIGIVIGYLTVNAIPAEIFKRVLGIIILIMLALEISLSFSNKQIQGGIIVTSVIGILAGIATMIANAAGPIFGVYLLQMGLTKEEFVGTRSWFFLIVNTFKLPFSAGLGLITVDTLMVDLMFIPVILLGAYIGFKVLKFIDIKLFKQFIRVAALVAAIRLIFY